MPSEQELDIAPVVIQVGDLIDRGANSVAALDLAMAGSGIVGAEDVQPHGNHEGMLRAFMEADDTDIGSATLLWLQNGGFNVLANLDVDLAVTGASAHQIRDAVRAALGQDRLAFLATCRSHYRMGRLLFVHAGVHPERSLEEFLRWPQALTPSDEDASPYWIRSTFLDWQDPFPEGVFVIHGHTPQREPELRSNRCNVDTGCVRGGPLTAAEIRGSRVRFHQTS